MPGEPLSAEQLDAGDVYQAIELYYERDWTDRLPVVPPTEKRVRGFLETISRHAARVADEVARILTAGAGGSRDA